MSEEIAQFLKLSFGGNTLATYAVAVGAFLGSGLTLKLLHLFVVKKLSTLAAKTKTDVDNILVNFLRTIGWPLSLAIGLTIGARFLTLPPIFLAALNLLVLAMVLFGATTALTHLISFGQTRVIQRWRNEGMKGDETLIGMIGKLLKTLVWLLTIIIFLQNLGYNISAFVAGLGLGGVALAFAAQNVLGDLFASATIYLERPFQTGDFIIAGPDMGTVKKIGIKSTRIQTLQGEELVISNRELTETRIHNYKRMERRRVLFSFGVAYETPTEKLRQIPGILLEIIEAHEIASLDRAHFKSFGDSSLIFEVAYYINTSEYNRYMDIQQEINLAIMERFKKEGIEFAYPTQTLYLRK